MFEILSKDGYEEYEAFVSRHPYGSFTQSVKWAEVKKNWGSAVLVSRDGNGKIRGGMALLIQELQGYGKTFLYAPRGPVMDPKDEETFLDLVKGVEELSRGLYAFHFKMDPMFLATDESFISLARKYGFEFSPDAGDGETIQCRSNYIKDLREFQGDPERLLSSFHPKWRYNIRLASRKGVECRICGEEAVSDFERLYQETAVRDRFLARPESYFTGFLRAFGEQARLYLCYYEGKPISGALCTNYAGKTCYVYGASSNEERNRMPNYLMQWNMMQWALETGCQVYDFQGIPVKLDGSGAMNGVYRFKKGFRGEAVLYAGEFDLIFDREVKRASDMAQRRLAEEKARKREEQAGQK